jgi:hypothetical protein
MNNAATFCVIVSITLISIYSLVMTSTGIQESLGINGSCGQGNVTGDKNDTLISDLMNSSYLKNLTADNPQLAEIVKFC